MSIRTTTVGAVLIALSLTVSAHAADITAKKKEGGCEKIKDCYSIDVKGEIKQDDFVKFDSLVKKNGIKDGAAAVYLDSPGGNLLSGMIMGLVIHKLGFATVVEQDKHCVSVCASMWVAGKQKFVASTAKIGFHQPYTLDRRGQPHRDPQGVSIMKKYYAEIGISKPAADFFLAADPKDAYWINSDLAAGFGIEAITLDEPKKEEPKKDASNTCMAGATTCPVTVPKAFIESLMTKKPL
jgi:hypothetical protein